MTQIQNFKQHTAWRPDPATSFGRVETLRYPQKRQVPKRYPSVKILLFQRRTCVEPLWQMATWSYGLLHAKLKRLTLDIQTFPSLIIRYSLSDIEYSFFRVFPFSCFRDECWVSSALRPLPSAFFPLFDIRHWIFDILIYLFSLLPSAPPFSFARLSLAKSMDGSMERAIS